jgi:eukaryotic-like serine/threonine-protein kinase
MTGRSKQRRSFGEGKYVAIERIGAGGMGVVHEVRVVATGERAALKTLSARLAANRQLLERFRREAAVMSRLDHPNVVRMIDFGVEPDGTAFLVMELLVGRSLLHLVQHEGPFEAVRAARLGAQIASGLAAAHDLGAVHRDMKPSNVVVIAREGAEIAKVIDFGLASIKEGDEYQRLTRTGQIVGTPNFMAPEQFHGVVPDARTDVYALGATLWSLLAGQPPYAGGEAADVFSRVLAGKRSRLEALRPDIGELAAVIERAMAIAPSARFASARELGLALSRHGGTTPSVAPAIAPSIAPTIAIDTRSSTPKLAPTVALAAPATSSRPPRPSAPVPDTLASERLRDSNRPAPRVKTQPRLAFLAGVAVALTLAATAAVIAALFATRGGSEPIAEARTTHASVIPVEVRVANDPGPIMRPRDAGPGEPPDAGPRAGASDEVATRPPILPPDSAPRGATMRTMVAPLDHSGDFDFVARLVGRNQRSFDRCWIASGAGAYHGSLTIDVQSDGLRTTTRSISAMPVLPGHRLDCMRLLFTQRGPTAASFYRGRVSVNVSPNQD